jgi:NADH dehydrogenase (ubiquinone) Fe-S protein 1
VLEPVDWETALTGVAAKMSQIEGGQMAALVGGLCDVESLVVLKELMNKLGSQTLCTEESFPMNAAGTDIRSNYLLNTKISGVEEADLLILIGTNIRFEAPVLNARIRKGFLHNNLRVAVLGQAVDLRYDYDHLGESIGALEELANGKHKFSDLMNKVSLLNISRKRRS